MTKEGPKKALKAIEKFASKRNFEIWGSMEEIESPIQRRRAGYEE